jgi:hypothetical protein
MKKRIGSALTGVSLLISCFFVAGCVPALGYVTIDWGSSVMQPTFCMYRDPYFQERLSIGSITVLKKLSASDEKKRWKDFQMVWELKYKSSDNFMRRLLTSPVSCLTYGEVPPGYQEIVKAVPLEPEQLYIVGLDGDDGTDADGVYFIIRLDASGTPERLEYRLTTFLQTNNPYRKYLKHQSLKLY